MSIIMFTNNFSTGDSVEAIRSPFILSLFYNFLNTDLLGLLNEETRIELILYVVKDCVSDTSFSLCNPSLQLI